MVEDFYCNYRLNPDYRPAFERAGLRVSGVGGAGEVRIVELPRHPFFLATLFCFQTRSTDRTHPLVAGFVQVVHARRPERPERADRAGKCPGQESNLRRRP